MKTIKYKYAIHSGNIIISIEDITIENRKEQFLCLSCGKELRPRIGNIRTHHFYHLHNIDNTSCGLETYLHNTAKIALYSKLKEKLKKNNPYYFFAFNLAYIVDEHDKISQKEYLKEYSNIDILESCINIELEKYINGFKPDILLEYTNKPPLFLEIVVKHKSSLEKRNNSVIIDIDIKKESDIDRICDYLDERYDEAFNFDNYRSVIIKHQKLKQPLERRESFSLKQQRESLEEICKFFKNKMLKVRINYHIDGNVIRNNYTHTEILLSDYYSDVVLKGKNIPYCEFSNISNSKLIISYDKQIQQLQENKYIILNYCKEKLSTIDSSQIYKTNMNLDISKLNDNYNLTVSCFIPKNNHMSDIKVMKYSELKECLEKDNIEIILIEKIRKV